ncbi:MAG: DNA repair protein RecO [Leptolyngbya sp. SIOISBB]|nr:DNA repair protein RecO [Leptolyngbya sp. SIOISBB]
MSRSYKATGINLKGMPMGETDRMVTVLTIEHGLIRVIVPGARKHKSRLAGRSSQFVVNELFIVQGKSLDKLVQAETVRSFPGLSAELSRLTASQYLAELVLCQALSGQPQGELFALLIEQLQRLEEVDSEEILACLSQGIFQLLVSAGVAPELQQCCVSQVEITPDLAQVDWRVGFSAVSGGVVSIDQMANLRNASPRARTPAGRYAVKAGSGRRFSRSPKSPPINLLSAQELVWLQQLGRAELITPRSLPGMATAEQRLLGWQRIERLLRQYAEFHFDRPIRSATLIDACFPLSLAPR